MDNNIAMIELPRMCPICYTELVKYEELGLYICPNGDYAEPIDRYAMVKKEEGTA